MRLVRPVVESLGGMQQGVRDLARLQEIARILARHGLGALVAWVPGLGGDRGLDTTPERALAALQELGPTFVKLGQVLSTRRDLLPEAYCDAFQQLQDDADPLPLADIEGQLARELGPTWRDRVARFDDAPLATASIAQVHRAWLHDGQAVVFKVQRPSIAAKIRADLHLLEVVARRVLVEYPEARSFDPLGVLAEFEASITAELDFHREAEHTRRFQRNFEGADFVRIPEVIDELTTGSVLCMAYLDGVKIRDAREAGLDMQIVGERYLRVAYDMLFEHGFFHGDLHPGNVIVLPDHVIGVIDFGMVGTLTQEMRNQIIAIIFALQRGDYRTIARLFYDIAIKDERVDYRAVERDTVEVMERYWAGVSIKDMQMGPYIVELAQRAARHGARVPPSYTMFFKAIMTSEGLAKSLISEVDPIAAAQPYFRRMLTERLSEERLQQELFYNVLTLSAIVGRVPVTIAQVLDDVDQQRLLLNVRSVDLDRRLRARDHLSRRTVFAAFAITLVLGGFVALLSDAFVPWGVPCIALTAWVAAVPFVLLTAWTLAFPHRG